MAKQAVPGFGLLHWQEGESAKNVLVLKKKYIYIYIYFKAIITIVIHVCRFLQGCHTLVVKVHVHVPGPVADFPLP